MSEERPGHAADLLMTRPGPVNVQQRPEEDQRICFQMFESSSHSSQSGGSSGLRVWSDPVCWETFRLRDFWFLCRLFSCFKHSSRKRSASLLKLTPVCFLCSSKVTATFQILQIHKFNNIELKRFSTIPSSFKKPFHSEWNKFTTISLFTANVNIFL